MRRDESGEARALESVTEEARRQPVPELGDALERRLFDTLAERSRAMPAQPSRSRSSMWLLPAAAAIAAGASLLTRPAPKVVPDEAQTTSATVELPPTVDGPRLSVGDVLAAHETPREVVHEGRARWVLEPGSRALVVAQNTRIVVRLLEGALRADVTPGDVPERFVVEAAGTRVAVHGTVFRVALDADGSVVNVEHGVVAVGPLDGSLSDPVLLRAPADARFSHDWQLHVKPRKAQTSKQPHRKQLPLMAPPPAPSAVSLLEPGADELTITEVEDGVATVVEVVTRCFEEHTVPSEDARIFVRTEITLEVLPDGTVGSVALSPPLSPIAQECSERDARVASFASSDAGATITRWLELTR